ncbi:SAV_915 family protein [Saccharopolyspora sp. NPDC049426]|uniref:SAV_915 family protein n=1 Tax=Saccharopolyspora sp. NPDC049426 TaxID=3155652 RepID=UPI0034451601
MRYGEKREQDIFAAPDSAAMSGVIGADNSDMEDEPDEGSRQQVFIPSERVQAGSADVKLELRRTEEDQLALLCYESLDLLLSACGNQQPWVSVYRQQLEEVQRTTSAEVVLWNALLPEETRKDD